MRKLTKGKNRFFPQNDSEMSENEPLMKKEKTIQGSFKQNVFNDVSDDKNAKSQQSRNRKFKYVIFIILAFIIAIAYVIYKKPQTKIDFEQEGQAPHEVALETLFNSFTLKMIENLDSEAYFQNIQTYFIEGGGIPNFENLKFPLFKEHELNCKNSDYNLVFTGNKESNPKYIIDVVLFGFDMDLLEIRLMEKFHLVDLFIICEQDATHQGVRKPFLFEKLSKTERFKNFLPKIKYVKQKIDVGTKMGHMDWTIERMLRQAPIDHLKNLKDVTNAFVIQNDGDELILHNALYHFKNCEIKEHVKERVYFPATYFKRNIAWLKGTSDLLGLKDSTHEELNGYLWRPGPTISPLEEVLKAGFTLRHHGGPLADRHKNIHMNLGSAIHISGNQKSF
jgi:hypothetical protein